MREHDHDLCKLYQIVMYMCLLFHRRVTFTPSLKVYVTCSNNLLSTTYYKVSSLSTIDYTLKSVWAYKYIE